MKSLLFALAFLFCITSNAADIEVKNAEYAARAKLAAKAVYDLTWGPTTAEQFEVIKEEYAELQDVEISGEYKIRVYQIENGEKSDSGIDVDVFISGNAILEVKVDCRSCG